MKSFILIFFSIAVHAQVDISPLSSLSTNFKYEANLSDGFEVYDFYIEHSNDVLGIPFKNSIKDESYTGGMQVQLRTTPILESVFIKFRKSETSLKFVQNSSRFKLGAIAFTPFNIKSRNVVEDRPYGPSHYFGIGFTSILNSFKRNSQKPTRKILDSQIYLGVIEGYADPVFQSWSI